MHAAQKMAVLQRFKKKKEKTNKQVFQGPNMIMDRGKYHFETFR